MTEPTGSGAAHLLIDKLKSFAETLEDDERQLLAALLAPSIDSAWGDPEFSGLSGEWAPTAHTDQQGSAVRARNLRVEGW